LGKFWGPWNGKCWCWPFGTCYGHLEYLTVIW
jgi:hypothetical protein